MSIFKSLTGLVTVELTGADPARTLSVLAERGIDVFQAEAKDELTLRLEICRRDFRKLKKIVRKRGDTLSLLRRSGLYWAGKRLLKRPVLVLGLAIFLVLVIYLPGHVLFIRVEGNENLPDNRILEAAENCGIRFGASRREVRSERVKNTLLEQIPELGWAGVNTNGCVAVISVRERAVSEDRPEVAKVSSIVADRDGVILSMTVARGSGKCTVGQAVKEGDILISGFTDCGLCVTATRAEGEIVAVTHRHLEVVAPSTWVKRGTKQHQTTKFSLIVGKNRINFYKGSGIYDASCVKMYAEYCLTLPGGFELPVKLVKEISTTCAMQTEATTNVEDLMADFADEYLCSQMIAGTILKHFETVTKDDGIWRMAGEYACTEMIGRVQTEEIGVLQ